ncbi:MAG TPA: caspase family protein [Polyangiales bacterium]
MRPASAHTILALAIVTALLACAGAASARVERFALIVGNNQGLRHEASLRYAESDARKLHDTLRDIGDFEPINITLLEGRDANTLRRTLIALNDRVRSSQGSPDTQAVLLVYFSGHADSEDLHLGETRLAISELSQLVRGSAADFRLLVLDACRSGVLTRTKGGKQVRPFDIPPPLELNGEGLAFLTASAEQELAQESDELGGSFFTHALVSGLLGAADRDRDGNVVLDEAYQYAYESTLRASSRSASGLQHPNFFYDLRGQGQLVLSRPFARSERRGTLELPKATGYLVLRDGEQGKVVAELGADDDVRTLSLPPGRYFVRGRTRSHVLEGSTRVEAGRVTRVQESALTRIEYAHLLRKGGADRTRVHAVEALAHARSPLPNADTPCFGALAGYRIDAVHSSWLVRAAYCTGTMELPSFSARTHELDLGVRGGRSFDLGAKSSIDVGLGLAFAYFMQTFADATRAPTRHSWAPLGELFVGASFELGLGAYATVDAAFQCFLLTMVDNTQRDQELRPALSARVGLGAGKRF